MRTELEICVMPPESTPAGVALESDHGTDSQPGPARDGDQARANSGAPPGADGRKDEQSEPKVSLQSRAALNAANFFLAEITGVVMPFLGDFFKEKQWSESTLGIAISLAGLGVFVFQTPAGMITDRVRARRTMLAGASIVLGICYGLLPLVPAHPGWVDPLLFIAGAGQAFFLPLLGALALGLVGHAALNRTMGHNQGWNHAGNLAAALLAMGLVSLFGLASVFYAVTAVSALAAASVFFIREKEVDENRASGVDKDGKSIALRELLKDRRVLVLLAATALFHLANAPVMPFLGAYIKELGGSHVQVAAVVLVAQAIMIPVALAAGWLCDRWGRKWIFGIGFVVLPLRIFLYSLTKDPWMLIALQTLDGIGAGIYGVVIVAICADLTKGKGGFNALSGMVSTALAVGGVIGPLGAGFLAEHLGYNGFFYVFAGIAAAAAILFITLMPETGTASATGRSG
jgi:MFS family permease